MFGPQRERPCPMCTSLLSAWDGEVPRHRAAHRARRRRALADRAARRLQARARLAASAAVFRHLRRVQPRLSALTEDGGDDAAFNVFTRRDGDTIRHFWGGEMNGASADPGQDPRGAPDLMPIWTILDVTPEGRGTDWYPKLNY